MSVDSELQPSKVARRTLIAGAAWAVPTIAVLSATPAFASSVGPLTVSIVNPHTDKNGASAIYFDMKVVSEASAPVTFVYNALVGPTGGTATGVASGTVTIAAGGTWTTSAEYPSGGGKATPGKYTITVTAQVGSEVYSATVGFTV